MLKILTVSFLFLSPLLAEQAPLKPSVIIETPAPLENQTDEQYNLKDKISSMLFSLGVIVVSVIAVTFILKRLGRKRLSAANSQSSIKVLEKRALNQKTFLYIVEAHNKTLLIGESPDGLTFLSELSPGHEEPLLEQAPLSFTQVLKRKFENLRP